MAWLKIKYRSLSSKSGTLSSITKPKGLFPWGILTFCWGPARLTHLPMSGKMAWSSGNSCTKFKKSRRAYSSPLNRYFRFRRKERKYSLRGKSKRKSRQRAVKTRTKQSRTRTKTWWQSCKQPWTTCCRRLSTRLRTGNGTCTTSTRGSGFSNSKSPSRRWIWWRKTCLINSRTSYL